MADLSPESNPPITAASITAAVGGLLVAFTEFTAEQTTAVMAVVGIVAAFFVQRFHTTPKGIAEP